MLTGRTCRFLIVVGALCCALGCMTGGKEYARGIKQYRAGDYRAAQRSFAASRNWYAKNKRAEKAGLTFDFVSRYAIPEKGQGENLGRATSVRYEGQEQMRIPAKDLPDSGVLKIWYPLPVQTASQDEIRVSNLSYEEYRFDCRKQLFNRA